MQLACKLAMLDLALQVTKITPRLVGTDILCVGTKPLPSDKFTGIVR